MTRDFSLLLMLTVLQELVTCRNLTAGESSGSNKLVHTIRRQLMADNYDYMSTETEEPFPAGRAPPDPDPTEEPETLPTPPDYDTQPDLLSPQVNDIFVPRSQATNEDINEFGNLSDDHGIAKNDLLYYVEDRRLQEERDTRRLGNEVLQSTTQKSKFKVIKIKQPGTEEDGRRAGGAGGGPSYRRFVQEENGNGVVIINLDDAPFPEFSLPSARRQYMTHEDYGDMEIAPISELSDEMLDKFDSV